MKQNKKKWKEQGFREELMSIIIVVLFCLGFFVLINSSEVSIIGYTGAGFISGVNSLSVGSVVKFEGVGVSKIEDDIRFNVNFSKISKQEDYFILEFSHDYNSSLDVWVEFVEEVENKSELSFGVTGNVVENVNLSENISNGVLQNFSNFGENISSDVLGNASIIDENVTGNATIIGSVLGNDSWTDFEVCYKVGSGKFECYKGSAVDLLSSHATVSGQGDIILKIGLRKSLIPHFKLHIGNKSEVYEFKEEQIQTQDSFNGFEIEDIGYGSSNNEPYEPANNTRQLDDREVNFIFNASAGISDEWENQTDGVDVGAIGAGSPLGITTNGSDFWFVDATDYFVYHLDVSGTNQSDGFSTTTFGSDYPKGITTNGSDFWIIDDFDGFVYHVDANGNNQSDGFDINSIGIGNSQGITTNGSDFWITDRSDDFMYHLNSTGDNQTDGFEIKIECGSDEPRGITTNGSDFWFVDYSNEVLYHLNSTGDNQTDGFDISQFGLDYPFGITSSSFNMSLVNPGGTPTEFWITDYEDDFIYHIKLSDTYIKNCSLLLNIDSAGYQTNSSLTPWYNYTDGVDIGAKCGAPINVPYGLTTNGSDFWILNWWIDTLYHFNSTFDLIGSVNVNTECGADSPKGITTNGSDFWITDSNDDVIYHLNSTYDNQSDSVNLLTECGANNPKGITTNGSDFWIIGANDKVIYHLNSTYDNQTDAVNVLTECSSISPTDITTNGSDFWFTDYYGDIYHINSTGDNQVDGIDVGPLCGVNEYLGGITTPSFIMAEGGAPTEFYIYDYNGLWLYHISYYVEEGVNQTFNIIFDYNQHDIDWKIQCYDDLGTPYNTSEMQLTLSATPAVNIWDPTDNSNMLTSYVNFTYNVSDLDGSDIDNCTLFLLKDGTWEENKTDTSITININQTFNITLEDSSISWKVGCWDKATVQANSSTYSLTVDTTPPTVNLQSPINNTNSSTPYINFTYNTTDSLLPIDSCVLWLYKNSVWELNYTDLTITETINQSINITIEESSILWKVECNDTLNHRANSTTYNITVDTTPPTVNLQSPTNQTTDTDGIVSHIFNVSDNLLPIANCSLLTKGSTDTSFSIKDTDTSITQTINQSINITYTTSETINWKITCRDITNNQGNSSTRELTIQIPAPPAEEEEVTARGSTSSGTGRYIERAPSEITETQATVTENIYSIDNLVPGETILEITEPYRVIIKVILDSAKESEDVIIKIQESRKSDLEKPENKIVYRYAKIESNLFESAINKIKIIFRVKKSFGKTTLLRYTYKWMELPTKKINEDEDYIYYESESPAFSTFAVVTGRTIIIEKIKEEIVKIAEVVVEKPNKTEIWLYAIIPIIILALTSLILLYYLIKITRHKKLTVEIIITGLVIIIIFIPFTTEILYWAVLPLSIISFLVFLTIFITWILAKRAIEIRAVEKFKAKLKQERKFLKKPIEIKKHLKKIIKPIKKIIKQEPVFTPQPIYYPQPAPQPKPKTQISPQKITNKYIKRFNLLLRYISIDISQNKISLANKRYKKILSVYKYLITKVSKEKQIRLYTDIEEIYQALRTAMEIDHFKK